MALQTSGAISLNQIHIEAGGTSGTQVSLNDTDVRGLISSTAGTSIDFDDFYGASAFEVNTDQHAVARQYNRNQVTNHQYARPVGHTVSSPDKKRTISYLVHGDPTAVSSAGRSRTFVDIFCYDTSVLSQSSLLIKRRVTNSGVGSYVSSGTTYHDKGGYRIVALDDKFIIICDQDFAVPSGFTGYSSHTTGGKLLHLICYNYSFVEQWRQVHTISGSSSQRGFMNGNAAEYLSGTILVDTTSNTSFAQYGFGIARRANSFSEPDNPPIYDGEYIYLLGSSTMLLLKIDPSDGSIVAKTAFRHTNNVAPVSGMTSLATPLAGMKQSAYDADQLLIYTYSARWMVINKSNLSIDSQGGANHLESGLGASLYSNVRTKDIADDPSNGDIYHLVFQSVPGGKFNTPTSRIAKQSRSSGFTSATVSLRRNWTITGNSERLLGVDSNYVYMWRQLAAVGSYGNGVGRMNKSNLSLPTTHHWVMQKRNIADNGWNGDNSQTNNVYQRNDMVETYVENDGTTVSYGFGYGDQRIADNTYYLLGTGQIVTDDLAATWTSSAATTGYNGFRMVQNQSISVDSGSSNYHDQNVALSTSTRTDFGGWTGGNTVNVSSSSTSGYWNVYNDTLPVWIYGTSSTTTPLQEFGTN